MKGKKVILRQIEKRDTDKIIYWRNQLFVRNKFILQDLFTKDSHEQWLETMVITGRVKQFIIEAGGRDNALPIGSVYLKDIDKINSKAEMGIFIGEKDYLGKGFGRDAVDVIVRYGFQELSLHKIMLRVLASNQRAVECYKKVGFLQEGYFREDVKIQNKFEDIIFMAILNEQNSKKQEKIL